MTQHPDDRPAGDRTDPEVDTWWPSDDEAQHPAIDHRESSSVGEDKAPATAAPLDVDQRATATASETPDIIELADHVEADRDFTPPKPDEPVTDTSPPADAGDPPRAFDPFEAPVGSAHDERRTRPDGADATVTGPSADTEPDQQADGGESTPASGPGPAPRATIEPSPAPTFATRASAGLSGVASKLRLGRLLATGDDSRQDQARGPRSTSRIESVNDQVADSVRAPLAMFTTAAHRRVLGAGFMLILVALLANSGGSALIVLSALLPIMIVITLVQHDVFEKESNLLVAAVGAGGAIVGVLLSLLSSWIQSSQWFDAGVLNFGAAGFGGRFADAAGSAPFVVWSLVGLVIPAVAVAGIAALPVGLRRWPQFRNEVMDGVILTGASAAGFAIGAGIVYWWPMIADPGPQTSVGDWTLSIIGVALLRTAVISLCGAMIGAGVWRYMVTPSSTVIVLPAAAGVLGYLLLTFGSIQLQAAGNWPEFLWVAVLLAAVFLLFRRVLDGAIATDRRALGDDDGRLVCPSCHKVTPAGAFCARCGKPLPAANPAPVETQPVPPTPSPAPSPEAPVS